MHIGSISALGPDRCIALPAFYASTGCDTVSFFGGRWKRTAWETWKAYDDVTPAFRASLLQSWLERFVVPIYNRTTPVSMKLGNSSTQKGMQYQEDCLPGWSLLGANDVLLQRFPHQANGVGTRKLVEVGK